LITFSWHFRHLIICVPLGQLLCFVLFLSLTGSEIYKIACRVDMTVEGGGSSVGAGRVCGNLERGLPVDIGDMSREWKSKEAEVHKNEFVYKCLLGDTDRSAIQLPVAIDGLTVAVKKGGVSAQCVSLLGGLSLDQLRWM
jgi:ABC-type phosphate transport system substrate-binding protein